MWPWPENRQQNKEKCLNWGQGLWSGGSGRTLKSRGKSSGTRKAKGAGPQGHPTVRAWQLQHIAGAGGIGKDVLDFSNHSPFLFFLFFPFFFLPPPPSFSLPHPPSFSLPLSFSMPCTFSHWPFPVSTFCLASIMLWYVITSPWTSAHTSSLSAEYCWQRCEDLSWCSGIEHRAGNQAVRRWMGRGDAFHPYLPSPLS